MPANNEASFEPTMLHSQQVLPTNQPDKSWLRQKHEPALWYMRFKRYLELGHKRSLRAVVASEPVSEKTTIGNRRKAKPTVKTLSEVSVPGAWSRAARVWNWKERAANYDLAEQEKEAQKIRNLANGQPFSSKAYRIAQLNFCARGLKSWMEEEARTPKSMLPMIARYQSIMRDIAREMQSFDGMTQTACDAAAMKQVRTEIEAEATKRRL